jgi:hypothetical protein
MSKWTAKASPVFSGCWEVRDGDDNIAADMIPDEAIAELMAAAPEMLDALREARDTLTEMYEAAYPGDESDNDVTEVIDMVIAAIAKAEGRE